MVEQWKRIYWLFKIFGLAPLFSVFASLWFIPGAGAYSLPPPWLGQCPAPRKKSCGAPAAAGMRERQTGSGRQKHFIDKINVFKFLLYL